MPLALALFFTYSLQSLAVSHPNSGCESYISASAGADWGANTSLIKYHKELPAHTTSPYLGETTYPSPVHLYYVESVEMKPVYYIVDDTCNILGYSYYRLK